MEVRVGSGLPQGQGLWVWVWRRSSWRRSPLTPPELPELTQDWEIHSWRAQQNLVNQDPGERNSDPTGDLPVGVQEISSESMGYWWPAAGLGAQNVAVHAWDLLREVTIIFITSTIVSVQSFSCVQLFVTPWTAAWQASLSITNFQSSLKLMSIELVMPSHHLNLHCPLVLSPSIFTSIRVFSNKSALRIRWPKYCSFSFNISPSNEHPGLVSFKTDWLDLLAVQGTLKSSPTP